MKNTLPTLIKKRSGYKVIFRKEKLRASIEKTIHHMRYNENPHIVKKLYEEILEELKKGKTETVTVDKIRGLIIKAFKSNSLDHLAEAYDYVFLEIQSRKVKKIIKRDGSRVEMHPYKIFKGVRKALQQVEIDDPLKAETVTKEALGLIEKKYGKEKIVPAEMVRDIIEYVFIRHGLERAADAYLLDRYA
ncbi:MAG: hypothetical protein COU08_01205 [Candidatus Harrisonbacteria bacterium CG10_big_fil_rev_8_21_14_0_10_42_17]|uniref:ATP-cone domain-containing protein n=1 Tax=Candidatus Harrisonbacteria bacterium CG10_big_fil_rev_8_21_14_0_10_42_17 TaxID=1974584 RepID=A0A2M6WIJ9_9BACT|nr:MAG: hypothetical protein COU08_01205 [Candidatus Harrisonbacteria bacterium CG10_big_fil_rev_8_21_14_0_10_42_17]